ncbi:MAG: hypothetical protein WBA68_11680 [Alteraurantiacibacter sp.]
MTPPPRRPNHGGAFEKWTVRMIVPALFLALFVAMYSVAGPRIDWRAWFDGPERGTWRAVTVDGMDVADERMEVVVANDEVAGGRDGCNYWAYSGKRDPATGERMMTTTLAGCEQTPERRAYDRLALETSQLRIVDDYTLEIRNRDTVGTFTRWTEEMAEAERLADQRAIDRANAERPRTPSPVYPGPAVRPGPPGEFPPPPPPAPYPPPDPQPPGDR